MVRIIGFFNQASSMGKTTLTFNLGYHLAQRKQRVLLIDMDSHAWLTKQMQLEPEELDLTIYRVLVEKADLPIHKNIYGMDLVPANKKLSVLDTSLASEEDRQFRLQQALKTVQQNYDFILLDCPPSLGLSCVMSLTAATHVLVPIETTDKGWEGAKDFLNTFKNVVERLNPYLRIAGVIPTRYATRSNVHNNKLTSIQNSFANGDIKVFPPIGRYTDFEGAWDEREPLAVYNPRHLAVKPLEKIAAYLEML